MADRKVLIKYYPPDFNPERLIRNPKQTDKQDHVRMMLPFSLKCYTCGNYLYIGTKFNMRKETCDEDYLGIPILRFYMKCTYCYSEITIKTDPKNHDYVCENGGSRNYEAWRDARAAENTLLEQRAEEEKGNSMKFLENRTKASKRDMDILDALDELKNMSRQDAKVTPEQLLQFLQDKHSSKIVVKDEDLEKFRRNQKLFRLEEGSTENETVGELPSDSELFETDPQVFLGKRKSSSEIEQEKKVTKNAKDQKTLISSKQEAKNLSSTDAEGLKSIPVETLKSDEDINPLQEISAEKPDPSKSHEIKAFGLTEAKEAQEDKTEENMLKRGILGIRLKKKGKAKEIEAEKEDSQKAKKIGFCDYSSDEDE